MKKVDIIDLTLKILGIHIIVIVFLNLKDLYFLSNMSSNYDGASLDILPIILFLGAGLIVILFGYFLIFKSEAIAGKIIKDDIEFKISFDENYYSLLEVAIIFIGLYILIFKLVYLISSVYRLINYLFTYNEHIVRFIENDIVIIIQYIIGFILVTNAKRITKWIIKTNMKNLTTPDGS